MVRFEQIKTLMKEDGGFVRVGADLAGSAWLFAAIFHYIDARLTPLGVIFGLTVAIWVIVQRAKNTKPAS